MRIALLILALWALVVEPTFGVFERLEQQHATTRQQPGGEEGCGDLDQPVPPGELAPTQWVNQHALIVLALPSLDLFELTPHQPDELVTSHAPLGTGPSLPYPPPALPLRL